MKKHSSSQTELVATLYIASISCFLHPEGPPPLFQMSNKENPKFKGLLLQEGSPDTFSRKPTLPPHGANSKAFLPYSLPFNVRLCGMCVLSCAPLFETPWTVAHQAPLPMGFFQARILEGVSISYFRGIFSTQGLNLYLFCLLHWRWILYLLTCLGLLLLLSRFSRVQLCAAP